MNEIDTSALSRFKKNDKPTTIDLSAFGKGTVEVQPKVTYETPKGFLKTNLPKIPSFIARKTGEYIKKEEDISKNLSLAEDFKRTFIEKPAEVAKFIVQGIASVPLTIGRSAMEAVATPLGKKEQIRSEFKQGEKFDETLFGGPIDTYQQITEKVRAGLDTSPDATLAEKKFLPGLIGLALLASDAFPGRPDVKKIGQELFDELAKDTDVANIEKRMIDFGVDENVAKKSAPSLVKAKTPEEVKSILLGKTGDRISEIFQVSDIVPPTPATRRTTIQNSKLNNSPTVTPSIDEAKKYKSAEEFVKAQSPKTTDAFLSKDMSKEDVTFLEYGVRVPKVDGEMVLKKARNNVDRYFSDINIEVDKSLLAKLTQDEKKVASNIFKAWEANKLAPHGYASNSPVRSILMRKKSEEIKRAISLLEKIDSKNIETWHEKGVRYFDINGRQISFHETTPVEITQAIEKYKYSGLSQQEFDKVIERIKKEHRGFYTDDGEFTYLNSDWLPLENKATIDKIRLNVNKKPLTLQQKNDLRILKESIGKTERTFYELQKNKPWIGIRTQLNPLKMTDAEYKQFLQNNVDLKGENISNKTRTQLEEIWKEANSKTGTTALLSEAKKYKSAEEFVDSQIDPTEQKNISDLLKRDQAALRPIRATGAVDIKGRNLRQEMEDNIKRYNTKIPDAEIRAIREQNLLNPETIDEIIARKRGIITDAEAIERAKTIQGTFDDVLGLPKGTAVTKEQYTAIEQIVQNEREINQSLKRALDEGVTTGGAAERKLLTESNPEYAGKTDEELLRLAYQESTMKLKKAEIILLGIRSEAGRSLQATKQFVEGVDNRLRILFSRINNNKKLDEFEKQAMVETITKLDTADNKAFMKALDDMSQSDMFDKIAEWSVSAKLWNPTTHIVNLGGNALRQVIDLGIKTVTNPVLAKADMAGAMNGLKLGLRSGMRTFTEDGYAQQLSKYIELGGKAPSLKGKFGVVARTPFRVLAAGDEIFRNMAYQRKLYRDAYSKAKKEKLESPQLERRMEELLNTPTFDMMESATKEAKKLTFQEDLGDIVSKINRLRDPASYETKGGKTLGVILRTFLPFLKTPTNLFKQSVDFTPFGLAKNWPELKKAAKEGDQEKVGTILGEAILGTALVSYIAMETMDGNITGGVPSDPAEKDRFYREKKLPYAIKMGDTWYQYQRLDPLALIIGMTADMAGADDKSVGALVGTVSQNLQDKTYLSGVSDFMKMLTGEDWEREYALKSALLGSAFPSIVGHIARSTDPTVRVADTVGQRLIAQTPGLSDELPSRVNVLGYNVERANKGLNYFFNPIQTEKAGLDPVTKELMKIDKNISIPNKTFQSEGITYSLNDREYEDFARYTGTKLRYELLKTFKTPKYEKADIDEKYNIIDGLRKDIMDEWKKEYLKDQKEKTGKKQIIRNIIQGKDPNAPAELETKEKIRQYFLSK